MDVKVSATGNHGPSGEAHHNRNQRVEMTVYTFGHGVIRVEDTEDDMYAAIDLVTDKVTDLLLLFFLSFTKNMYLRLSTILISIHAAAFFVGVICMYMICYMICEHVPAHQCHVHHAHQGVDSLIDGPAVET